jgi:hypothetical protein
MELKDKVALAKLLAVDWLRAFEFLNVVEDERTEDLDEAAQVEIFDIITTALAAEMKR